MKEIFIFEYKYFKPENLLSFLILALEHMINILIVELRKL